MITSWQPFLLAHHRLRPVMFKGIGALSQRAAGGGCLDTDTARTVVSSSFIY